LVAPHKSCERRRVARKKSRREPHQRDTLSPGTGLQEIIGLLPPIARAVQHSDDDYDLSFDSVEDKPAPEGSGQYPVPHIPQTPVIQPGLRRCQGKTGDRLEGLKGRIQKPAGGVGIIQCNPCSAQHQVLVNCRPDKIAPHRLRLDGRINPTATLASQSPRFAGVESIEQFRLQFASVLK
jgi:hypothetical protein